MRKIKDLDCFLSVRYPYWICAVYFIFGINSVCFSQAAAVSGNITAAQQYYDKGKEYLDQGEFQKADDQFKQAEIILEPGQEIAESKIPGNQAAAVKTVGTQEQSIVPAVKVESKENTADVDLDREISKYREVLKTDRRNSKVYYYNLGVVYAKKKDYLNAAKMFDKVVSLDRRDYEAYYNLGTLYETIFLNHAKAIACYQLYLKFAPSGKEKETVATWLEYLKMQ